MKTKINIILFLISFLICMCDETDSLSSANDYKNNKGVQIYMNKENTIFSYISINTNITDKLSATLYAYTTFKHGDSNNGFYVAIGFGTSDMDNSDILLCGINKDSSFFCKDYNGVGHNIQQKESITTLNNSKYELPNSSFAPYNYKYSWSITRNMDPQNIINGKIPAISSYGGLSSPNIPVVHNSYNSFKTGDGNLGSTFIETAQEQNPGTSTGDNGTTSNNDTKPTNQGTSNDTNSTNTTTVLGNNTTTSNKTNSTNSTNSTASNKTNSTNSTTSAQEATNKANSGSQSTGVGNFSILKSLAFILYIILI